MLDAALPIGRGSVSVLGSWVKPRGARQGTRKGGKGRRTPTQDPSTYKDCARDEALATDLAIGRGGGALSASAEKQSASRDGM